LKKRMEARSESARHVILKYEGKFYHINRVTVRQSEEKTTYNAVFRAKRLDNNQILDLDFDIPQSLYETLVEYARLGDSDLLLVLQVDGEVFRWRFVSESWLRQQTESKISRYVV